MQAAARRQFLMVGWPFRAPVNFCLFLMKMARPVAIQYVASYIDRRQSTVDSVRMQFIRNYRWVFKFVGRRLNAKENMLKVKRVNWYGSTVLNASFRPLVTKCRGPAFILESKAHDAFSKRTLLLPTSSHNTSFDIMLYIFS